MLESSYFKCIGKQKRAGEEGEEIGEEKGERERQREKLSSTKRIL